MKVFRKILSAFLVMTLLIVLCSFGVSAEASTEATATMVRTASFDSVEEYPDGGKDYTFYINGIENHYYVPPTDFEPLIASDEELARYYFPSRPDETDEEAYSAWIELMSAYTGTPDPELAYYIEHTEPSADVASYTITSVSDLGAYNWSGYIADLGYPSTTLFTQVQGDYKEPTISSVTETGYNANSYWVGLGGVNTQKLVQAGTATYGLSDHYAWYEYLSDDTGETVVVQPVSLSVNAGDMIHLYISFQRSNNLFSYYIANNTTGQSVSSTVTLDASTQYDGTTAEWVVERTTVKGSYSNLANYDTVTFTNCQATLNTSNTWYELGSFSTLYKVYMGNGSGTVLSEPSDISSNNSFTCTWKSFN